MSTISEELLRINNAKDVLKTKMNSAGQSTTGTIDILIDTLVIGESLDNTYGIVVVNTQSPEFIGKTVTVTKDGAEVASGVFNSNGQTHVLVTSSGTYYFTVTF